MKDTCSECRFFGKNACIRNETDPQASKCADFYRANRDQGKEAKPIRKTCGVALEGYYEAVVDNDRPIFLVRGNDGFSLMEQVTNDSKPVVPKASNEYPYSPYGYMDGPIPSREDLFWMIRNELDTFLDVESIHKEFLAACVLISYQQEKLATVPYGFFVGDNESGKTVALSLLNWLCYRPLMGVTIPSADIYGYLDDIDESGTILEDEIQGIEKDIDKTKIYKAGYKQGAKVPRYKEAAQGKYIKYYPCFCLKFCAGEEIPRLKGFRERFIFVPMVEGYPKKDWADINGEDKKRLQHIRNSLLKWRLASREWQLPEPDVPVKGRLKELWKPVMQMANGLTVEKDLLAYLSSLKTERMDEKRNTLEGHIVHVVAQSYEPDERLDFLNIWDGLQSDLNASIDTKNANVMVTGEFGNVTKSKVGYRLRELFGGKKNAERDKTTKKLAWTYSFDPAKLKRVLLKYGEDDVVSKLESSPTSQCTESSMIVGKDHENAMPKPRYGPLELTELANSLTGSATTITSSDHVGKSRNSVPAMDISNILAWLRMEFEHGNNPVREGPKALEPFEKGKCPLCQQSGNLTHQIQFTDGSRIDAICLVCSGKINDLIEEYRGPPGRLCVSP